MIAPSLPVFVNMYGWFWSDIFVNAGPKSNAVITVAPHSSNILVILSTDVVLNLSPKSKLVIAVFPVA